ncbi:uncharacterized protein PGTG_19619 [Puccinia graminis f. sp. tritici CRL 75-36-700-3]|uniref:DNA helicase Pif1-like 2B domain-containing protein n=1 Tax=Puccinia graminis f. sp. tritici (strain CRL 75-36-700-3 / race SCCL) TaxID=418459 RepID=E3LAP5_PUCGT|nr:uncharacterized protein PGTG_19619 [Puccinia graminis f. sp. tritici CRL 75-36-700-3]EFP93620.1 hypothetical protein PGTG_19619 [Puccinia graminis f. sp. tritici CRL 75-36-700-3]
MPIRHIYQAIHLTQSLQIKLRTAIHPKGVLTATLKSSRIWPTFSDLLFFSTRLGHHVILFNYYIHYPLISELVKTNVSFSAFCVERPDDSTEGAIAIEALNQLDIAGFPNYDLEFKVGAPIMLLQNLGISQGLCNGTRYQFPMALAFAMTIKKCQGQSMDCVELVLESQTFVHVHSLGVCMDLD